MGLVPTSGRSGPSGAKAAATVARRAETAPAEAARRAAEAARAAAEAARKAAEAAKRAAEAAHPQLAAAQKTAADAQKAAQKPGQTPEAAAKSKAAAAATALNQAADTYATADKSLQDAGERVALTAKKAEEAMGKANTVATQEKKPRPFTQKDLDAVKPKNNELVLAFGDTLLQAEREKLLGVHATRTEPVKPPPGEMPPAALDALDAKDLADARKVQDGKTYTDPSSGAKYQVKKDVTTGDTVLSNKDSGHTVTLKPDGSYTSTVQTKDPTRSGGTRDTTWTKTSDAKGNPLSLASSKTQAEQHPETGATTTSTHTQYDTRRSPPVPMTRSEEVRMEKPPAALASKQGVPQGPASMKTQTQFNAQGLPTKQLKTTELHTPGYDAAKVGSFESSQNTALQNASKGENHHDTRRDAHNLKVGESSLTLTEETRFNAKGEPAASKQKTESVSVRAMPSDKNGNGVQVVRAQQEVTRGPKDAVVTDTLPAISSKTPGNVTARSVVTGYDPDGSRFDDGYANRTQTVLQGSGTVDANGRTQMKYQPTEVKSLQEADGNRWKYDHVGFETGADGKPVPGKAPKTLDKERQLPFYEDAKDFVTEGLSDLANFAGDVASDTLGFARDVVLKPIKAAIDQLTAPLEKVLADQIRTLKTPGTSIFLEANLDIKVGLKAGINGDFAVEMMSDGKYRLSTEVTGDVGVGLVGSASLASGGRVELTFDTPEEVARAAIIIGKGPSALALGGEDQKFMFEHLSAMDVNVGAEAEAGLGAKLGPSSAELSASIGATSSFRVEFDKGKPTHLVRTTDIQGSGAASIAGGLMGKLGLNYGGEVSGSVSMETRIPLDASKLGATNVLAFLASPATAALAGPAETTFSVDCTLDQGSKGRFFRGTVSGLSGEEVQNVTKKLFDGKFDTAFNDVRVDVDYTDGAFKHYEAGAGMSMGIVDFEISVKYSENGPGGPTRTSVRLDRGRRRPGGSDGTSGGGSSDSKPSGSNGTTAGNGQQPGTTPSNVLRVNPATGQLSSQGPRTEQPGTAETRRTPPEQGTDNTGRPPVSVERNPALHGRTPRVRYDNGEVRIEAGPDATKEDIQAHMPTARALQRYEGAAGKVRQLIDKVKQILTGMPGYGTQGFESGMEVKKLNNILKSLQATQAQLDGDIKGATGSNTPQTAAQRADLERRISSVENQLRTHESQVNSLTPGRGYVAMEDDTTPRTNEGTPLKYESLSEPVRKAFTSAEVGRIADHGRSLGLNDQQISDFLVVGSIENPSKGKVALTPEQVQQQMTNWKTVVEPRGFPYRFQDKQQLAEFQQKIKNLSAEYGLPPGDMVIQGSSLRTPEAKDVDVALVVSDAEFEAYAQRARDTMVANFRDPTSKNSRKLLKEFDQRVADGFIPMFNFSRIGGTRDYDGDGTQERTFSRDFWHDIRKHLGFDVDFSVMRRSSKVDRYPAVAF